MDTPEWLKPGMIGAAAGAVIAVVLGFTVAGWMTASSANRTGQAMADEQVVAALVPVCVERASLDPDRAGKLAAIRVATGTGRRDAVVASGWATVSGNATATRNLAAACLVALDLSSA